MSVRIALLALLVLGACARDDAPEPKSEPPVLEETPAAATHEVEVVVLGMT